MNARQSRRLAPILLSACLLSSEACTHNIHVTPVPSRTSSASIDQAVRVAVPQLAVQGPDRMPGISLLNWPAGDLRQAIVEYARQRNTFRAVGEDQGSLILTVNAWLWVRSREAYQYTVQLESDLGTTGTPPTKTYVVKKEAVGSRIRWVTATDRDPIAAAVQAALDDLFMQIEEDAALYGRK